MNLKIFLLILSLGILIHFLPNLNIPLHSDVTWYFRLQATNNPKLIESIPEGFKEFGAYPMPIFESIVNWYQLTGRINVLDYLSLRLFAFLAGADANLWRFFYILILSSSITLFYLILKKLNIPAKIALFFSIGFFFIPIDIWTDYKSAEPKALLFLMLSLYFGLTSKDRLHSLLSCTSLLVALLFKETFILSLPAILGLILWKEKVIDQIKRPVVVTVLPYLVVVLIIALFSLSFRFLIPMKTSGYVIAPFSQLDFLSYLLKFTPSLIPGLLLGIGPWLITLSLILIFISFKYLKMEKVKKFYLNASFLTLILILLCTILLNILLYYLTNRDFRDRYLLPSNFFTALTLALLTIPLTTQLYSKLKKNKAKLSIIYLSILMILFCFQFIKVIDVSFQNRIDQNAWQSLINQVKIKVPKNGHILISINDPFLIETAQSLEANTLFLGRYDLTYHLVAARELKEYQKGKDYLAFLISSFNKDRKSLPLKKEGKILTIHLERPKTTIPYFPFSLKSLIVNPKSYLYQRFIKSKQPYLKYSILIS
ncbi:hypothetical protein HYS91_03010 [Candidatus Daviesbacteria bacterium]|nr:hypothetical protein [Candidatus Daviesbacteria bacterium]